jgi:hypothetical protein
MLHGRELLLSRNKHYTLQQEDKKQQQLLESRHQASGESRPAAFGLRFQLFLVASGNNFIGD